MKVQIINKNKEKVNQSKLVRWVQKIVQELSHQNIVNQTTTHKVNYRLSPLRYSSFIRPDMKSKSRSNTGKASAFSHNWGSNKISILLAFVSELEIKKLNYQFRKKNKTTDILSFASVQQHSIGELIICMPVVKKTKPKLWTQQEWLYYLILHGVLHLLGFDHEKSPAEAKKMYHIQNTVFQNLNPKIRGILFS